MHFRIIKMKTVYTLFGWEIGNIQLHICIKPIALRQELISK